MRLLSSAVYQTFGDIITVSSPHLSTGVWYYYCHFRAAHYNTAYLRCQAHCTNVSVPLTWSTSRLHCYINGGIMKKYVCMILLLLCATTYASQRTVVAEEFTTTTG